MSSSSYLSPKRRASQRLVSHLENDEESEEGKLARIRAPKPPRSPSPEKKPLSASLSRPNLDDIKGKSATFMADTSKDVVAPSSMASSYSINAYSNSKLSGIRGRDPNVHVSTILSGEHRSIRNLHRQPSQDRGSLLKLENMRNKSVSDPRMMMLLDPATYMLEGSASGYVQQSHQELRSTLEADTNHASSFSRLQGGHGLGTLITEAAGTVSGSGTGSYAGIGGNGINNPMNPTSPTPPSRGRPIRTDSDVSNTRLASQTANNLELINGSDVGVIDGVNIQQSVAGSTFTGNTGNVSNAGENTVASRQPSVARRHILETMSTSPRTSVTRTMDRPQDPLMTSPPMRLRTESFGHGGAGYYPVDSGGDSRRLSIVSQHSSGPTPPQFASLPSQPQPPEKTSAYSLLLDESKVKNEGLFPSDPYEHSWMFQKFQSIWKKIVRPISHDNKVLRFWTGIIDVLHLCNLLLVPLMLGWTEFFAGTKILLPALVIDFLLLVDCAVQAKLSYTDDYGQLVEDPSKIVMRYLWHRNGFLEIISSLPCELLAFVSDKVTFEFNSRGTPANMDPVM
ncbi:hypothetical protein HDU76_013437 [Blyttiomyces sp. JEL0837]|nr:hypothetical protein HDU76_013437 [Blyttiomyces sp. JEL0837]